MNATGSGGRRRRRPPRPNRDDDSPHGLAGGGSSQLGVSRALRARDVNRPTDDDLADAERQVQIVRRDWRPPKA